MTEQGLEASKPLTPSSGQGLVCRLRLKCAADGQRPPPPLTGEIDLENASAGMVEIEWQMSPLQYLDLVVTDSRGNVVSEGFYGDCFSPLAKVQILRLRPGEKYTHNVSLLGNVPGDKQLPGMYTVRAVYQYRTLRVVAEPIQVHYDPANDCAHDGAQE